MSDWNKVEKEKGTDTKIVKVEDREPTEMTWKKLGDITWLDIANMTWKDWFYGFVLMWTKVKKSIGNWEKVEK